MSSKERTAKFRQRQALKDNFDSNLYLREGSLNFLSYSNLFILKIYFTKIYSY